MYLSKSPTFRFWLKVYSFPAMIPLVVQVIFEFTTRGTLVEALGSRGSVIATEIDLSLGTSFIVLVILANALAFWHQLHEPQPGAERPVGSP